MPKLLFFALFTLFFSTPSFAQNKTSADEQREVADEKGYSPAYLERIEESGGRRDTGTEFMRDDGVPPYEPPFQKNQSSR